MELTIGNLIKIIIGLIVIVAVIYGVYRVFQGSIFDFFGGVGNTSKVFLSLLT